MKRITRKHLNDSIELNTRFGGRQSVACKIHKGLAVTPSLNPNISGYRVTHVATGRVVTSYFFKLNQAWDVLLTIAPITDWTQQNLKKLAAAASLSPSEFQKLVVSIVHGLVWSKKI